MVPALFNGEPEAEALTTDAVEERADCEKSYGASVNGYPSGHRKVHRAKLKVGLTEALTVADEPLLLVDPLAFSAERE